MKKNLFIALFFAILTGISYQAHGATEKEKQLEKKLKEQAELVNSLSKKVNALSSKNIFVLIKEAITEKIQQITESPYTLAMYRSRPAYAVQAMGWLCIAGASLYIWADLVQKNDALFEHNKGWFVFGALLITVPNIVNNLHNALKDQTDNSAAESAA
jgi:6-phosphofructokinase